MEKEYGTINPDGPRPIIVRRSVYLGRERVDIRAHYHDADGHAHPTSRGVSLPVEQLPGLMDALRRLEAEAIDRGDLLRFHYSDAGFAIPPAFDRREAGR